jgi:RNA polymerase II-associated protein 3
MELQKALRQQNEDLREELKSLEVWEQDVEQKEAAKKKKMMKDDLPALPPIRGTVPSLKAHQKATSTTGKPKEDPIQVAKDQGNEYFKQGKIEDAIRLYTKGIDMDPDTSSTHVLYANRAMCYLKVNDFERAERDATKCVQMNRGYVKAFYRRAQARRGLKKYKDARSDLETVLALQPGDNDAETELRAVTQLLREENKKAELGTAAPARKKIVIAEVDDDEDEEESSSPQGSQEPDESAAETAARDKRIERDMEELEVKRKMEETKRRLAAEKEEADRQRSRRTHDRVEIIEDDDEPAPKPAAPAPKPKAASPTTSTERKSESTKREGSQAAKAPVPRNLKVEWTKETITSPKNFTEFERVYKDVQSNVELLDALISAVPTSAYKAVFAVNMTPELLMDILKSAGRGTGVRAKEIVDALASLSRVGELAMFFDDSERDTLKATLHLVQSSGASTSDMNRLRKAFEL